MSAATLQDAVDALARLGCKPTKSGDGYVAYCPIHEADGQGHKPSLTLKAGDKVPVVVNCHAGCDGREILRVLGITPAPSHNGKRRIVATYSYRDLDGREAFQKIRYEPKDFLQRWPDGQGGWLWKRPGNAPYVLYRLPELRAAIAEGRTVFICEGEKDADRLASLGLVATSNVEGASKPEQRPKWKAEYTAQLEGAARVILLHDNDEQGRAHMRHVAEQLAGKVGEVRWLDLPGLPEKGDDVSDWLDAGHTVDELKELAQAAESPTAEQPKTEGQGIQPPKWKPLDLDAMRDARLHPRCIVEYQLYADLAVMNAEGGTGKTTLLLYEAIHIALGLDLWGCRVLNPGRTLFITAEDGEEILLARLLRIMDALGLNDWQRRKVADSIMFWDLSGTMARLAELDARGNLVLTELADRIVETYRDAGLAQVIFDPVISFSPGERIINDGEQAIVTACRRITRGLDCCVRLIHHSGQANARNGAIDQYAGRGGTALPDGCRMVTILANATRVLLPKPDGFDLQPGESGFLMARAKLSYAPPQPNIWIRRRGWAFDYFIETPCNAEAVRDHDADKVADFLVEELHHGRRYTARSLEDSGRLKLPRARLRAALATLETAGRLDERELPTDQRRGRKKHYLHCAKASGAIAAETPPEQPTSPPIAPDISIAPPLRETRNGAIDAVPVSPASLHCANPNGAIAAQWRNSDESPPDTPTHPAVEAAPPTAPTLAKAQATNRQRINESLEGMVELPGGGWVIPATPAEPPPAPVDDGKNWGEI